MPTPTPDYATELRQAITTYYATLNAAVHDPAIHTDALARLIAPSCECRSIVDLLRREARDGRYLDYSYRVENVRVISVGDLGGNATFVVVQSPGHERASDGRVLHTYRGGKDTFSVHFVRTTAGGWLLDRTSRST